MVLHRHVEHVEFITEIPEVDSGSDYTGSEMDEEEIDMWYKNAYKRGSIKPMKEPLTASWGLPISDTDMKKIKVGSRSRNMDEKWNILIEDPDENGNISLHIIRCWAQQECCILHIVPKPSNDDNGDANIQGITWEGSKGGLQCDAEQAKKEAVILSRMLLHCEFETLPHYPLSMLYYSRAYKKLDSK
ncbi:hypothetical protein MFRU_010g02870 [Monilinia fructicola]|nr:hypothetical protein MFRU_010g02870 [Monilinia fructicola]